MPVLGRHVRHHRHCVLAGCFGIDVIDVALALLAFGAELRIVERLPVCLLQVLEPRRRHARRRHHDAPEVGDCVVEIEQPLRVGIELDRLVNGRGVGEEPRLLAAHDRHREILLSQYIIVG